MNFHRYLEFNHLVEALGVCSECDAENTGPSREWRPEGAPTTERGADCLLLNKGMSAVEVSVVFRPLQKKITEQCTEFIAMLLLNSVRKSNLHLQTNEEIGIPYR